MPVHNADIAAIFTEFADLLEIDGANPFRVRAYRNAARTLGELSRDVRGMLEQGADLTELPGIGDDLAGKIREIVATGRCAALDRLQRRIPHQVAELLKLPGLGPKRVRALYRELDIRTVAQLERAVRDGRLRKLRGFGPKTEQRLAEALAAHAAGPRRYKLAVASQYATALAEYLGLTPGVSDVVVAGSFRRMRDTVGDLDLVVATRDPIGVTRRFVAYDEVRDVVAKGPARSSVRLKSGIQVDLRVVEPQALGAALHYFTGSRAHVVALRRLGQGRGLKINEYGVYRGKDRLAGDTEESVFAAVGLPWIPPELREDRGEIEAGRAGTLPSLIETGDLRGDLHVHTRETDGHNTLAEMAEAARARGLEYLAITEHSQRLAMARGLDPARLAKQIDAIDELNDRLKGITLLKGIEVDILDDGSLDLPDRVLSRLDLVVGAVHSKFRLSRGRQTARILKAMDHPYFSLLAHPTGRLIGVRDSCELDMQRIVRHARQRGCFLELNAHPDRLDLLDVHCQMARDEGVLVAINSDAHSAQDFDNLRYGVGQARRGWLEKKDVLNARPLKSVQALLRKTMSSARAASPARSSS
jgi:DNA polymerase (family 10)